MRWLLKASVQRLASALPAAERVNYVFQRHVARTLPVDEAAFRRKARRAARHLAAFEKHGSGRPLAEAVLYEFGAGWDLGGPLVNWALGVERQVLVDIRPNVHLDLVAGSAARLRPPAASLERAAGRPLREPGAAEVRSLAELEDRFGILYLAPRDARATGLPAASVDLVTSTNTLEHVPADELVPILTECRRLICPGGLLSCRIDLRDHWSYFDASLSPYNFLTLSDRRWSLVNPELMYQNRLRYPDYLEALGQAGFEVVAERVRRPREEDVEMLRSLALAERFRGCYTMEELGVRSLAVVARPLPDAFEERQDLGR